MSLDLLGEGFDLHGGAIDLIFPHHENERAQAVALGREFARHWVHNGWVTVDGEKMSKSLGNFTSLEDLLSRGDARAYRLLVLRSHYRSPIEITPGNVAQAEAQLDRLDEMARRFGVGDPLEGGPVVCGSDGVPLDADALVRFHERMDDDLDTPGALAGIFELVRDANAAGDAGELDRAQHLAHTVAVLSGALGLALHGEVDEEVDAATAECVVRRDRARAEGEWALADSLRAELEGAGWVVEDGPGGTRLRRR
jgi:cysteinyl-tRNA synthetase